MPSPPRMSSVWSGDFAKIWRYGRLFPGYRSFLFAECRVAANDILSARSNRTEQDDIVFVTQVRRLADLLVRDVIVWNSQSVELDAEPAFVLRIEPGMNSAIRGTQIACVATSGILSTAVTVRPRSLAVLSQRVAKSAGLPSALITYEPALKFLSPILNGASADENFTSFKRYLS